MVRLCTCHWRTVITFSKRRTFFEVFYSWVRVPLVQWSCGWGSFRGWLEARLLPRNIHHCLSITSICLSQTNRYKKMSNLGGPLAKHLWKIVVVASCMHRCTRTSPVYGYMRAVSASHRLHMQVGRYHLLVNSIQLLYSCTRRSGVSSVNYILAAAMLSTSVSTIDLDEPNHDSPNHNSKATQSSKKTKSGMTSKLTSNLSEMASVVHNIGQQSSVFSVARALTARTWKPALLWWSAIAIFAGVLIWQLSLVFINYYSYGVNTVISESLQYSVSYLSQWCYSNISLIKRVASSLV